MAPPAAPAVDLPALKSHLLAAGVRGVTIAWCDLNGVQRSRTVPIERLESAVERGIGFSALFAVFTTHDLITFEHEPLSTPSGDIRAIATADRITPLAGQPAFAWSPARQFTQDGSRWAYCPRGVLERQVERAAAAGFELQAGYELEWFIGHDTDDVEPAHAGPVYGPKAMLQVDEFAAELLGDLAANGLAIGQLHAEYGLAQMELSLPAADPVRAADDQLLARQTIHAAARANGLRASFAPLVTADGVGNGWHVHSSVLRAGENLLAGGDGRNGLTAEGEAYCAGVLRDLPAIVAVSAPSVPSLLRRRPGWFASAYAFWGVENREAALRFVAGTPLVGAQNANLELKPSDASGNPYLALAAVIGAGLGGIEDGLTLPEPIQEDPGGWDDDERRRRGVRALADTPAEQEQALVDAPRVRAALGEELCDAFLAVRRADASWAEGKSPEDIVAAHRWRY